jgi:pilus assembly protein CpaC
MNGSFMNARCLLGGLLLSAALPALGAARTAPQAEPGAPAAAPFEHGDAGARCSGEAARPAQLALQMGRSTMLRLPEAVTNRSVGNPAVVQALLVAPDTLYIAGVDVGTTNMIVQGKSGMCSVVDIVVAMDPAALQATFANVMPEERSIRVVAAADSLVLTGTVADASAVARAVELANAYVRRPLRPLPAARKDDPAAPQQNQQQAGSNSGTRVVNLLSVSAPQQVQLEVKIAEVSKTLLESLETSAAFHFGGSAWAATLVSNFPAGEPRRRRHRQPKQRQAAARCRGAEERRGGARAGRAQRHGDQRPGRQLPCRRQVLHPGRPGEQPRLAGREGVRRRPALHADRAVRRAHQPARRARSVGAVA